MKFKLIYLLIIIHSCNINISKVNIPIPGKYMTYRPDKLKCILLERKHQKDVKDMWVGLLYLRDDGSFVMGACDNQILMAGKYIFEKDSLTLYQIFNFKHSQEVPNKRIPVENDGKTLYYILPNTISTPFYKKYRFKERIVIMKRDVKSHHNGFLRNENWSLDSIFSYNEYWTNKKQMIWVDSVLRSRINK